MMRFFHKPSVAAVITLVLSASAITAYADWRPDRGSTTKPVTSLRKATPQARYLQSKGISSPDARIKSARTGLAPTPRIARRPANLLKSPQAPRGNVYGVVNRFKGMQYTGEAYVGKLDLASGAMQPLHYSPLYSPYAGDDYLLQTNTYRNGEIICPSVQFGFDNSVTWDFIDLETGDYLRTLDFGSDMMANPYTMTYDPDNDLIYMVCIDGESDGNLSVADPNNDYEVTYIGNLRAKGNFIAAIAYNMADHQLYAFNNSNTAFIVDPKDGKLIEAGYLELPTGELLFEEGTTGQMVYSPADEMFVCVYRDNSIQASRILYIHPETFEVFEGEVVTAASTPYVTSLFCTDEFATADAPELPAAPGVDFDKASLSGSITVTAPLYTYAGVALGSSKVRMVVDIDGKIIFNEEMAPGATKTFECTLTEAEHDLQLYAYLGDERSPVRRLAFYTGNDDPTAPADIRLTGNKLTWSAPGATGVHGGFVDTSALTYQVYLSGNLQNQTPLTSTSFEMAVPETYDFYDIWVVASANGHSSPEGTLSTLFGRPLELPFHQAPAKNETKFYTIANSNRDEMTWFYLSGDDSEAGMGEQYYGWCMAPGYFDTADDWLFLPAMNLPDPEALYTLSYNSCGIFEMPTNESYEVWIGEAANPASMREGTCIFSNPSYQASARLDANVIDFGIKKGGSYVIGFHYTGSPNIESQGIVLNEFDLRTADGRTSAIPSDPADVKIKAADLGRNAVEAEITLPTLDLAGNPLPASDEITVTLSDGTDSASAKGQPGATVDVTLEVAECGHHYISVTPSNANGKGYSRTYRLYVGIDRPTAPTDLRVEPAADNLSVRLNWSAPGTTGENNGYVDPAGLKYNIYARGESNSASRVGQTTETEFTFSPFSTQYASLVAYSIGASAVNEGGESYNTQYTVEQLGTPYELPMLEEWGVQNFTYNPYTAMTTGRYASSAWQNAGSMDGMGVGDPLFIQGGLIAYVDQGSGYAKVSFPKATTVGISKANFILRYWDYHSAPDAIQIYGRRFGQTEEKLLGEFTPKHPAGGEWIDAVLPLPEDYMNCPWIEVRVGCHFPGRSELEYLIIDSFQFFPDADYDLKVTSLTGNEHICIGETANYHVIVANSGRERVSGTLTVELADASGKVYASSNAKVPALNSNQVYEYDAAFDINGLYRDINDLKVTARVDCEDENMANNTRSLPLRVAAGTLPVVNDLTGEMTDGGVRLTWSEPATEYGDFETFEAHTPFRVSEQLDMWLNHDLDGLKPITLTNNATGQALAWEGSEQPQGWTVVDVEAIGYMNDPRLAPHSGKNVLMARAGDFPYDADPSGYQSSKWLISPEIKGGTELSFWMSTLAADIPEYIEVWYSETDTNLDPEHATSTRNGSFRRARTFSKDGAETWELISCQFPAKAKYFAIRYCSYDGAAVLIDDISFSPAKMLDREISHYTIFRSDDGGDFKAVADDITATSHLDSTWPDSKAWYYVQTVAATTDGKIGGPRSNMVFIEGTDVKNVSSTALISAGRGEALIIGLEGEQYAVSSADGALVASGTVTSARQAVKLEPGVYVVKAGPLAATLMVR